MFASRYRAERANFRTLHRSLGVYALPVEGWHWGIAGAGTPRRVGLSGRGPQERHPCRDDGPRERGFIALPRVKPLGYAM